MFELRVKGAEGIARVFYCTAVVRRIVILHQFTKKSEKTPRRELKIASRRMKEVFALRKKASTGKSAGMSAAMSLATACPLPTAG